MIAEPLDLDLATQFFDINRGHDIAEEIQSSIVVAWRSTQDLTLLQGLRWAYRDCRFDYAADEITFLLEIRGLQ